jgi:hypothetical protein
MAMLEYGDVGIYWDFKNAKSSGDAVVAADTNVECKVLPGVPQCRKY